MVTVHLSLAFRVLAFSHHRNIPLLDLPLVYSVLVLL